ncbi:MAG TPA: GreA/GreB family elongation factor [Gillisia sp.]|nr:GreA/GreB family elongation factor [Gillisia sp.]
MSRGFVKEDDQEEAPLIPPRAALPAGVTNYVTPEGLEALLLEKAKLEEEKAANKKENEAERRYENMMIEGKLKLLIERINSARVVEPAEDASKEVRFGSTVTLKTIKGRKVGFIRKFTIVGVDEADVKLGKIAFIAPIAKAVTGHKEKDFVSFQVGGDVEELEVMEVQ